MNYRKPTSWIVIFAIISCIVLAICFLTNPVTDDDTSSAEIGVEIPALDLGSVYVSKETVYMNMLSSYLALDGDSGYKYRIEENSFTMIKKTTGEEDNYDVENWEWKVFPYTDDEWAELFHQPEGFDIAFEGITGKFTRIGYLPIDKELFLLSLDDKLHIVDLNTDASGTYIWSIYSLVPENVITSDTQEETIAVESQMNMDEVHKELEFLVGSIGLENAYSWNNTVEFKEDADVLIKLASDETGRFEIYGIMSAKYGTYGLLLNDWIGGEQNWNFAYVPWYYSGAPSDQPILEPDGNGKYVFAYVYKYEDGIPLMKEWILDCGYDTGHMELMSQEDYDAMLEYNNETPVEETERLDI